MAGCVIVAGCGTVANLCSVELNLSPNGSAPRSSDTALTIPYVHVQCFSTSGSRPHLGSPSDFRGVARLSTNFLKNDIGLRTEKFLPNSPTYSTDVGVLRGWGRAQITV